MCSLSVWIIFGVTTVKNINIVLFVLYIVLCLDLLFVTATFNQTSSGSSAPFQHMVTIRLPECSTAIIEGTFLTQAAGSLRNHRAMSNHCSSFQVLCAIFLCILPVNFPELLPVLYFNLTSLTAKRRLVINHAEGDGRHMITLETSAQHKFSSVVLRGEWKKKWQHTHRLTQRNIKDCARKQLIYF